MFALPDFESILERTPAEETVETKKDERSHTVDGNNEVVVQITYLSFERSTILAARSAHIVRSKDYLQ